MGFEVEGVWVKAGWGWGFGFRGSGFGFRVSGFGQPQDADGSIGLEQLLYVDFRFAVKRARVVGRALLGEAFAANLGLGFRV